MKKGDVERRVGRMEGQGREGRRGRDRMLTFVFILCVYRLVFLKVFLELAS